MSDQSNIQSVLQEDRVFDPPEDFIDRCGGAWIESMEDYRELHRESVEDPKQFWGAVAG